MQLVSLIPASDSPDVLGDGGESVTPLALSLHTKPPQ